MSIVLQIMEGKMSIISNYYQNYIVRVLDDRNRLFAYKVKFLVNFCRICPSDRIIIGNREYLINKNVSQQQEKVLELLNIF